MSSFPYKLHQLLTDIENNEELSSIISWLPSGNGFRIHQPIVFQELLLKKYFPRQSKLKSFKRQVQYYGFENLGRGSYSHQCFVRGKRSLCGKIIHKLPMKNVKKSSKNTIASTNAKQTAKMVSRSSSPASLKMAPMPVFSGSGNLPRLDAQAFAMSSPVTSSKDLVTPKGLAMTPGMLPMFAPLPAASTASNMAFNNNATFMNPTTPLNYQQQAMQLEYMKLMLLTR